ncbi:iron complex transport system permease protein [Epibacterium ulvae]|uniref:Iron complex transport system permease protein n=1 Tax=Epibacterium ulvae TaxID=1156985 RepID=A0A1G5QU19_9RHOB|nr:iron complex transport system permease protein [Epibacterium ulvae]
MPSAGFWAKTRTGVGWAYCATLVGLFGLAGTSLFVGVQDLSLRTAFTDPEAFQLLLVSRLPRTLAALLTGASMAVSGVIMQLLVRNRFVEPGTTGTNESAMLGLLAVTLLAPSLPIFAKMLVAALAALVGTFGFMRLARHLPPQQPLLLPLVGLIYAGVLYALATFLAYQTDLIQYIGIWLAGEFSGVIAGRYELLWLAGAVSLVAYIAADQFTLVGLGRGLSLSLGLRYGQVVALGVATVSMVAALVIVTVGTLPFVGLVVPNVVARMMGDNLRQSLPVVAGLGAGLVLACDLLGRVLRAPYEIPAGTIFGVLGAVLFLSLLLGRRPNG